MDLKKLFSGKKSFEGAIFYYYLPNMNYLLKKPIGEEISKYKGVNILYYFLIQTISLSLQNECFILIEDSKILKTKNFQKDILINGSVTYYNGNIIKTINNDNNSNVKFNCLTLKCI